MNKKNTLFIGSPWVFIEKDLKKGELLEKIYKYFYSLEYDHNK